MCPTSSPRSARRRNSSSCWRIRTSRGVVRRYDATLYVRSFGHRCVGRMLCPDPCLLPLAGWVTSGTYVHGRKPRHLSSCRATPYGSFLLTRDSHSGISGDGRPTASRSTLRRVRVAEVRGNFEDIWTWPGPPSTSWKRFSSLQLLKDTSRWKSSEN